MPTPLDAYENRIGDAIHTALAAIGTPAPDWLTTPVLADGTPPDSVPSDGTSRIYLEWERTVDQEEMSATGTHAARIFWHIWLVSQKTPIEAARRELRKLKADVSRAWIAGENSFIAAGAKGGAYRLQCEYRSDISGLGTAVAIYEVCADIFIADATAATDA